ncbi:MAG TPA: YciI family protein [Solirubrobacterales bacterium]|jgi:hypothetical protein
MSAAEDTGILEGHGLRLFQLYGLFGTPSAAWDIAAAEVQQALEDHVDFLRKLEAAGQMFMGGPFRAPDYEWDGSGMIIVRADSLAAARATAERDPLFLAGLRTYDVRGWQLNEGRLVLTLDLDSNRIEVA